MPETLDVGQAVALEAQGQSPLLAARPLALATAANGNGVPTDQIMPGLAETEQWYATDAHLAQVAYKRLQDALATAQP